MMRKLLLLCLVLSVLGFSAGDGIAQESDDYNQDSNTDTYELENEYDESDDYEYDEYDDYDSYDEEDYVDNPNFTLETGEKLPRSERSKSFHAEIEKVLAGDDFSHKETVTRRRFIDFFDEVESEDAVEEQKFPLWIIKALRAIERYREALGAFALLIEILIWVLVIGLIVFIALKYREQLSDWASDLRGDEPEPELPTTLFGLDVQKDSIPDDVIQVAQNHWNQGEHRQAVATILRASLVKLLHEHQCRFFSSDTEAECCDRIDEQAPSVVSAYLRKLVAVWQRVAYAHIEPSKAEFDELCLQWKEVF